MRIGIILQSGDSERVWNAFRFGIVSLKAGHKATVFLMNEGAELGNVPDTKDFDISAKTAEFKELGGEIYACGTCLEIRNKRENAVCPVSTMTDLLKLVEESEKVLVF